MFSCVSLELAALILSSKNSLFRKKNKSEFLCNFSLVPIIFWLEACAWIDLSFTLLNHVRVIQSYDTLAASTLPTASWQRSPGSRAPLGRSRCGGSFPLGSESTIFRLARKNVYDFSTSGSVGQGSVEH
jgi:hypothetical protein